MCIHVRHAQADAFSAELFNGAEVLGLLERELQQALSGGAGSQRSPSPQQSRGRQSPQHFGGRQSNPLSPRGVDMLADGLPPRPRSSTQNLRAPSPHAPSPRTTPRGPSPQTVREGSPTSERTRNERENVLTEQLERVVSQLRTCRGELAAAQGELLKNTGLLQELRSEVATAQQELSSSHATVKELQAAKTLLMQV